jgi:hypothetical protein
MRKTVFAFLTLALLATVSIAAGTKRVTLAGVTWEPSLVNAEFRAKVEHKPILHLQMFGRLDDALC